MSRHTKSSIDGFVKVGRDYSMRVWFVDLWNPETEEFKTVACEDTEYDRPTMGMVSREYDATTRIWMLTDMPYFGGSDEIEKAFHEWEYQRNVKANHIMVGMTIEVVKGRKYPIGTIGVIKGFSSFYDRYGREQTRYVVTTDGKRIPWQNCKAIA